MHIYYSKFQIIQDHPGPIHDLAELWPFSNEITAGSQAEDLLVIGRVWGMMYYETVWDTMNHSSEGSVSGHISSSSMAGWWLGHPFEKYEFVNWDDNRNPILMGK